MNTFFTCSQHFQSSSYFCRNFESQGGLQVSVTETESLSIFARLALTWQGVADYFVPRHLAKTKEKSNRARMFLISHTLGPVMGNSVPIALYAVDPTPGYGVAVLALSISLFWLFPFLLRAGLGYNKLVLLSVINLNFAILWSCYHYGGVASPTLTWVLIIPILSLFYVGGERRLQPWLLAVTSAMFGLFFFAYIWFQPPPNDIPETAMLALGAVSTIATLCYVATMAIYYARVFDSGVDLENEVKRRRALADELRRAVARAHRTGSAKSEFLARMSHEIRTPLNAIIGYGQILQEEAEELEDKMLGEDVARILDAAHYLVRLVNMVLDLSKIEAGRMKFDQKPHKISTLVETAISAREESIAEHGSQLSVHMETARKMVEVDEHRFLQVADSILENAIVHTEAGEITITIRTLVTADGQEMFRVAIADSGKGIPPETIGTLFQTFATGENAADGRYGGTGLNLTVCYQLCRAMGGTIEVESEMGRGSVFTIVLPVMPPEPVEVSAGPEDGERDAA